MKNSRQEKKGELSVAQETTDKESRFKGVPCTEKELKEHLKSFSDIDESATFIDKPRHWKK